MMRAVTVLEGLMLVTIAGIPTGLHTDLLPSLRRSLEVGWPREETKITLLPCSKTHPLVIRVSDKPKKASVNAIRLYVAEVCATHSSAHGWWYKGFYFDPLNQHPKLGKEEK